MAHLGSQTLRLILTYQPPELGPRFPPPNQLRMHLSHSFCFRYYKGERFLTLDTESFSSQSLSNNGAGCQLISHFFPSVVVLKQWPHSCLRGIPRRGLENRKMQGPSKTFKKQLWPPVTAAANTSMTTRWQQSYIITAKASVAQKIAFPENTKNLIERTQRKLKSKITI